ncbi:MAG: methyltransferase domain-containing protein [Elusimicrobia bacterium]|nr:methyltransferase domain-containing protein [Elusimicrobiota bacterium]
MSASGVIPISKCRICGNPRLASILDLGRQAPTGIFVKDPRQLAAPGPLELVKCEEDGGGRSCGLVQLRHSYDLEKLYGENYGYRSGLNRSMVEHLHSKVAAIRKKVKLGAGDLVVDVGSNDGTLLRAYPETLTRVGIDPTAAKFKKYYPANVLVIPKFFSAKAIREAAGTTRAKVITSIAMFYDLESPMDFMREIRDVLHDEGIWVFEQSYMPAMLETNSYDTVCHEHLEYYGLRQIQWMAGRVGLKIVDVEWNEVNGGSFSVTAAKDDSSLKEKSSVIEKALARELALGLSTLKPYEEFRGRVQRHREHLLKRLKDIRGQGGRLLGYGASTKGNVLLQFCGLTRKDIPYIAEINEDKFGCVTPGSEIPIISEAEARAMSPDYFLVLPWHFRKGIIERERDFLKRGGKMLFPLPQIEEVTS